MLIFPKAFYDANYSFLYDNLNSAPIFLEDYALLSVKNRLLSGTSQAILYNKKKSHCQAKSDIAALS